jgi:hypothetical protein
VSNFVILPKICSHFKDVNRFDQILTPSWYGPCHKYLIAEKFVAEFITDGGRK